MQELPIPQLKNKNRFKTLFYQISVVLLVAVTHMLLFSLFTQKYATHRDRHSDSPTARKVFTVRLLGDSRLTPEQTTSISDPEALSIEPATPPPEQYLPPPDLEPEKSDSLLGQETPAQAGFITSSALSEKPVVQVDINPDIALRLASNVNRVAILRLRIDELGGVDQVFFEEGDFTEAEIEFLISACKAMKFAPGKLGKTSVKSEMRIEMSIEALHMIKLSR